MQKLIVGLAVLGVVLTGCDRVKSLLNGDGAHTQPPAAAAASSNQADNKDDNLLQQMQAKEKALIANSGGRIERSGTMLTFKVDGAAVATFNDADWMLTGAFNGINSAGKADRFYVFALLEATDTQHFSLIVNSKGVPETWVPEDVLVYGDGPLFAAGTIGLDHGTLEIDDWSTAKHLSASFDGTCLPDKWLSETELSVECTSEITDSFKATVKKISAKTWQFQPKGDKADVTPTSPFDKDQMDYAVKAGFRQIKAN